MCGIDRKALAGLLLEIAQQLEARARARSRTAYSRLDLRLEQLRTLLLGREIEVLSRLERGGGRSRAARGGGRTRAADRDRPGDERCAAGAGAGARLEKATQSSIRSDPHTLVNILYPLIVPAIRKSIGETIDETFQSLNESLKHSLTWRGLQMALGSLAHRNVLRRGRAQAHARLSGRARLPDPSSHRSADLPCRGRECGEPGSAAGLVDAGGDPGFRPGFLQRRRAAGARHAAAGRAQAVVRAGTVRDAGRGDPGRSAGRACTTRCATHCRGSMPSATMRWRASTATAPALRISRHNWPKSWRSSSGLRRVSGPACDV